MRHNIYLISVKIFTGLVMNLNLVNKKVLKFLNRECSRCVVVVLKIEVVMWW